MSSRLAVFGGTFDPVHNGHIEAARYALRRLAVSRLKMIPCNRPNHKAAANSDSAHRLVMLDLACADDARIEVDPIEINRSGVSYTVDTLIELKRLEDSIVFVLGIDSFNTLPQWHRWSELLDLCHFLVLARPGCKISRSTEELLGIEKRLVRSPEQMFQSESGRVLCADDFSFDISSTGLRERLTGDADVSAELNTQVSAYIRENHLYV